MIAGRRVTIWLLPAIFAAQLSAQTPDTQTGRRKGDSVFFLIDTNDEPEGHGGRDDKIWVAEFIEAVDYRTGKVRWKHDIGPGGAFQGLLSTAGTLLFTGDNSGNALALDPQEGIPHSPSPSRAS